MSIAPEEFEKLQKLLKLKRHEQPPPGYFNTFATHVVNRLERQKEQDRKWGDAGWVFRFLTTLETNPIAAGLFGVSVCGLLITGIAYSQYRTPSEYSVNSTMTLDVADSGVNSMQAPGLTQTASVDSLAPTTALFDTNTATFNNVKLPATERVNFRVKQ